MNFFIIADSAALYVGPLKENSLHRHYAVQWTMSLDRTFLLEDSTVSMQEHRLDSQGAPVLILLADPLSRTGQFLSALSQEDSILSPEQKNRIVAFVKNPTNDKSNEKYLYTILSILGMDDIEPSYPDLTLIKVLEDIEDHLAESYSVKDFADLACLSESRFQHKFTQEMGIPVTQYILWQRMKRAIRLSIQSRDLTSSAYQSGFSDSAHFSRTFKRMFGISPSSILKNSRNVQVFFTE